MNVRNNDFAQMSTAEDGLVSGFRRVTFLVILALAFVVEGSLPCCATEIIWGFDGVVTSVGDQNTPPALMVGSPFTGTIHFSTQPGGSTVYDEGALQSYVWRGPSIGIVVSAGGVDFSTLGLSDTRLQMTIYNNTFSSFPEQAFIDGLFIGAASEMYRIPVFGDFGYRRNIFLEFRDPDQNLLSDVVLPLGPPDIRLAETARIEAGVPFGGGTAVFSGRIDRLFVIPEPGGVSLLGMGLSLLCVVHFVRVLTAKHSKYGNQ